MVRNRRLLTCARVLGFALGVQVAFAQKCYYPNGEEAAPEDKPCSSAEGSACCPDKWECLDNGMCYYPADKIYGRYSCTDQKWEAEGCPSNLCTYDKTAYGAENMQQCSDHNNQWCCNADNVNVACCKESPEPRPFFDLKDGSAYATIGAKQADQAPILATITGMATSGSGGGGSTPTPSPGPNSEAGSASKEGSAAPTGPSTPITTIATRLSSGTAGIVTLTVTSVIQPSPASSETGSPSPTTSSKSKLPLIVGLAVGIPLALALLGILIWLLRKRSQQKKNTAFPESPNPYSNGAATPDFAGGAKLHKHSGSTGEYESKTNVPELAGQSVGPGRPVSNIQGKAELDSGAGFAPGAVAHAPHLVGVGGGSGHSPQASWGSAPPGYSPGMNQNAWAPAGTNAVPAGVVEADGSAVRPGTGGSATAPAAGAVTTEGGRYIPYRPPQGHGQSGLHNVTQVSEMNAVTTPPATELSAVRTPPA